MLPYKSINYHGTRINTYFADKDDGLPKHIHRYAHLVICLNGSCIIKKENIELKIDKNFGAVNLVANEWHEIMALEDNTVFITVFDEKFL